eukprot:TRINITY_DN10233_c0_g1_i2.p1 TRINITY_DN10233_c0_g1~~TRINITY_DN10233_c0_g1_i2.p1  ORF type:complete len:389 (+),score=48.06 TRINITY_DN10233_c0_g1_i2:376-1542(+)
MILCPYFQIVGKSLVNDKESMIESRFPLLGRDFIEEFGCQIQDYHDMAQRELSMWKDGNITKALINEGLEVHHSCIIVQVISNVAYIYAGKRAKNEEVYLHGWTEWRTMFLSMLERIHVPDVEFVLCLAERPVVVRHDSWAVFGFVDSDLHNDIVIPAGHHHIVTKNEKIEIPWANRKQKLFWRGSPTGITPARVISNKMKPLNSYPLLNAMPRVRLARLSQKEEPLIDAAFWSTYASDLYPEISEALSDLTKPWFANDECHYKYLIALEGDSSCREFSSLLQYGSVVLRPKHKYREYFHDFLEPNVHYVPISNDLESLGEVIQSLSNEPDRMEAIAKQGRMITKNLMRPQELYCFYWRLFHSYRQLMNFEVVKRKGAVPLAGVVTKE